MSASEAEISRIKTYLQMGFLASFFLLFLKTAVFVRGIFHNISLEGTIGSLFELVILGLLVFGIWKKSRICSVLVLVYFLLDRVYVKSLITSHNGLISDTSNFELMVFLIFFLPLIQGIRGTFSYHKLLLKNEKIN